MLFRLTLSFHIFFPFYLNNEEIMKSLTMIVDLFRFTSIRFWLSLFNATLYSRQCSLFWGLCVKLKYSYSSLLSVSVSIMYSLWLPQWVRGKESTCNAKDVAGAPVSIPWLGRSPGERNDNSFHGKPHRWKSPAGYSPWGPKSWTWFRIWTTKCIFYFPFSLSDSLYLKRVSCLQHIVESTLQ